MPNYQIALNQVQDAILTWVAGNYNTEHDTTLTNQQFVQTSFPLVLAPHVENYRNSISDTVLRRFRLADPAVQAQVLALLGP